MSRQFSAGRYAPYPSGGGRGDGQRYFSGGHHGGGGRGGRGGGRGGRGQDPPFRPTLDVKTNFFRATYTSSPEGQFWFLHKVSLIPQRRVKDEEKNTFTMEDIRESSAKKFQENILAKGSNEEIRNIMIQVAKHVTETTGKLFAADLSQLGVSPSPIWDYGGHKEQDYMVKVDRRHYRAIIEFTGSVPMSSWTTMPSTAEQLEGTRKIRQCLDILFKFAMAQNCLAVGRNPNTFYLKENLQQQLIEGRHAFSEYYSQPRAFAPFIGLSQSACFNNRGQFFLAFNNKVDWLYRSALSCGAEPSSDVPILDERRQEIAGIRVNLGEKITDPRVREKIEDTLKKLTFKVIYEKGPAWEEGRRAIGKDEEYIRKWKLCNISKGLMRGKLPDNKNDFSSKEDKIEPGPRIKWSCFEEVFDRKEGDRIVTQNVADYFKNIYDIPLKYPNMPLISVSVGRKNKGFFPIEFLFHDTSSRVGGNDGDKVTKVLAYHDAHAGPGRVDHITRVKGMAFREGRDNSLESLFQKFNISVNDEPESIPARRLRAPPLLFANNDIEDRVGSGSWNLNRKVFYTPAELTSFAVVDFCRDGGRKLPATNFVDSLLKAMKGHGMKVLNGGLSQKAIIRARGTTPDEVCTALNAAKEAARRDYLSRTFYFGNVFSTVDATLDSCWIGLLDNKHHRISSKDAPTHLITNAATGVKVNARIQFKTQDGWLDPSQVSGDNKITETQIGFRTQGYDGIIQPSEISGTEPLEILEDWQIECPSLVICYLPDDGTQLYDCVKTMCDLDVGFNSQCAVQEKASGQRRIEQYCSNIALKVNTKLFCRNNKASAWILRDRIDWLEEKPTMIIGYSMAFGRVNGMATTAIAGSVCLSSFMQMGQAVRFQISNHRTDTLESSLVMSLVKELAINYFQHTGIVPQRMILFRDGGSGGSFDNIANEEKAAVEAAMAELNQNTPLECPITFMVANKDHNMRVVPKYREDAIKGNVPSGTLVDDVVSTFTLNNDNRFDFLITAQGGLKGTSKPMHYHCILNENPAFNKERTAELIYKMAFQFGTATKSPRKVPVLLNSDRLANRAISYGSYMNLAGLNMMPSDEGERELVVRDRDDKKVNLHSGYSPFRHGGEKQSESGNWVSKISCRIFKMVANHAKHSKEGPIPSPHHSLRT